MLLFIIIILAAFFIWALNVPIPKGLSRPYYLRTTLAKAKIIGLYTSLQEWSGIRTRLENRRKATAAVTARLPKPSTDGMEIKEIQFDGVRVRMFSPSEPCRNDGGYPAMLFIHGGGWVRGSIDIFDFNAIRLTKELNIIVVSIAYRLAPEHPFPEPFDDCVTATKYFLMNASRFEADPRRVVLCGTSAGGNLVAAVTLKLKNDRFEPMPKRQQLIYPCLQVMDLNTPSMIQNASGPFLTREVMAWYWSLYISGSDKYKDAFLRTSHIPKAVKHSMSKGMLNHHMVGEKLRYKPYTVPDYDTLPSDDHLWNELKDRLLNPYCLPLVADDLSGLPDALVVNCRYDVLRDDGIMYARRLQDAGVKVSEHLIESGFHGLDIMPEYQEGEDLFNIIAKDLKSNV